MIVDQRPIAWFRALSQYLTPNVDGFALMIAVPQPNETVLWPQEEHYL